MNKPAAFKRRPDAEAVQLGNDWLILHADQYTVTTLNEMGSVCWSLLRQGRSVRELAEEVCRRYETSREEAERDIQAFIDHLLTLGLVVHEE